MDPRSGEWGASLQEGSSHASKQRLQQQHRAARLPVSGFGEHAVEPILAWGLVVADVFDGKENLIIPS